MIKTNSKYNYIFYMFLLHLVYHEFLAEYLFILYLKNLF